MAIEIINAVNSQDEKYKIKPIDLNNPDDGQENLVVKNEMVTEGMNWDTMHFIIFNYNIPILA